MKEKILLIIFLFFYIFINAQNPIQLYKYLLQNTVNRYTKYPDQTTSTQCDFVFKIQSVDTSNSGVQLKISESSVVSFIQLSAPQYGNYSQTIYAAFSNDSSIINNITINYFCEEINFDSLTYTYFTFNNSSDNDIQKMELITGSGIYLFNVPSFGTIKEYSTMKINFLGNKDLTLLVPLPNYKASIYCLSTSSFSPTTPIYKNEEGIVYMGTFGYIGEIPSSFSLPPFDIISIPSNETNLMKSSMFSLFGNSIDKYTGTSLNYIFGGFQKTMTYPFGFNFIITRGGFIGIRTQSINWNALIFHCKLVRNSSVLPTLLNFEIVKLFDGLYVFRITIKDGTYLRITNDNGYAFIGYDSLVSNRNGKKYFEFVILYRVSPFQAFDIYNDFGTKVTYK
ncbi:hypothetical protein ACTFIY_009585 [Dictyostelium cf. discoideum]